ncbi:hypothetical protein DCCM_3837 [Desulfocucumis palustris]|uniref:Uncharacterized protein n=1 Tax=Desulfocucumis palustris TaxID=1898651 RepID=A0A2L2XEE8_9FIRM|nr:hypothetical protein DCCM_3837 [Desulfocucumis palustris]
MVGKTTVTFAGKPVNAPASPGTVLKYIYRENVKTVLYFE